MLWPQKPKDLDTYDPAEFIVLLITFRTNPILYLLLIESVGATDWVIILLDVADACKLHHILKWHPYLIKEYSFLLIPQMVAIKLQ